MQYKINVYWKRKANLKRSVTTIKYIYLPSHSYVWKLLAFKTKKIHVLFSYDRHWCAFIIRFLWIRSILSVFTASLYSFSIPPDLQSTTTTTSTTPATTTEIPICPIQALINKVVEEILFLPLLSFWDDQSRHNWRFK